MSKSRKPMVQTRRWTQLQTFPNPNEPIKSTQKQRTAVVWKNHNRTNTGPNKQIVLYFYPAPISTPKTFFKHASPSVIVPKLTKTAKAVKTPTPQQLPLPTPFSWNVKVLRLLVTFPYLLRLLVGDATKGMA